MKHLRELAVLLLIWCLGEVISDFIPFIPGAILGMLLLCFALGAGVLRENQIAGVGDFFLKNIAIFFVPASIRLMTLAGIRLIDVVLLMLVCVVTTFITMCVTALVTHALSRTAEGSS